MAKIAGRNARLFVGVTSGSAATEMAYISSFEVNAASDRYDVTSYGDTSKTYVAGLSDASGSFSGFFDTASAQSYTAAADGLARRYYFYPDLTGAPTVYFYGTGFFDFSATFPVDGAATVSGTWSAATPMYKAG